MDWKIYKSTREEYAGYSYVLNESIIIETNIINVEIYDKNKLELEFVIVFDIKDEIKDVYIVNFGSRVIFKDGLLNENETLVIKNNLIEEIKTFIDYKLNDVKCPKKVIKDLKKIKQIINMEE